MYILYTLIAGAGGGQMSNTFFESGGKCPHLLIIRGEDVLIYHFHRGGGQMSEGANVLHSDQNGQLCNRLNSQVLKGSNQ